MTTKARRALIKERQYTPQDLPPHSPDYFTLRIGDRLFGVIRGKEEVAPSQWEWAGWGVNDITEFRKLKSKEPFERRWNMSVIHVGGRFSTIQAAVEAAQRYEQEQK